MKLKKLLLPLLTGSCLILPSLGDPVTHLIQNPAAEAASDPLTEKLGFAAHLPKNTEGYFSVIGAYDLYERLGDSKFGKLMLEIMADQGADIEELEAGEEFSIFRAIVGEELFVAFGDSSGEQAVHLNAVSSSYNFQTMKMLVKMMELQLSPEPDYDKMQSLFMGMMQGILNDPNAGLATLEKAKMPPLTLGFKVSDKEVRMQIFDTIAAGLQMPLAENDFPGKELKEKKDGVEMTGFTMVGKMLADLASKEADEDALELFGSKEKMETALKVLEKKNLNVAVGLKGDYIVIYVGDSLEGLSFATKSEDSLVANKGMDFMTKYADKDIRMVLFGEEEAFDTMSPSTDVIASMAQGLKAGLKDSTFFGDTRDVQALLGYAAKLEKSMIGLVDYTRMGGVAFLEDGFKMEFHGGSNLPTIDTKTPHLFAGLGELEDVVFFSNSRSNPEFTSKLYDLMNSLGEAAYLMASRTADLEAKSPDLAQFAEGFKMFDQVAAKDLKRIWEALTVDWAQGTGNEGALIVDTKGTLPKVPGIPGTIIEKGLMPRIAYVTPLTDRVKVASAWAKIETSIKNILKTVEQMDGPPIPMQEIEDATKDGVTYYKTAIQFSTSDARPVVGLSEKNFFFSTSEKFIAELNAAMEKEAPVRSGSYTRIDFSAARGLAVFWVDLLKENADEIFENEFQRDDFKENLPMIEKALKAFAELENFTSHARMEGEESRTSIHLKIK